MTCVLIQRDEESLFIRNLGYFPFDLHLKHKGSPLGRLFIVQPFKEQTILRSNFPDYDFDLIQINLENEQVYND